MARRRHDRPWPWREWALSALLGVGLALALIVCLGRAARTASGLLRWSIWMISWRGAWAGGSTS